MNRVLNLFNRPIWNSLLISSVMLIGLIVLGVFSMQQLQDSQSQRILVASNQIQTQTEQLLKQALKTRSVQGLQRSFENNQFSSIIEEFALVGLIAAEQAFYFAASDSRLVGKKVNSTLWKTLTDDSGSTMQSVTFNYLGKSQPFIQILYKVETQEFNEQTLYSQVLLRETPFLEQQRAHLNWLMIITIAFVLLSLIITWILNSKTAVNVRAVGSVIDQILENQPKIEPPIDNHHFSQLGQKLVTMHNSWKSAQSKIKQYKTDLLQNKQLGRLKEEHYKQETVGIVLHLKGIDKLLDENHNNVQEFKTKILQILDATSKNFEGRLLNFDGSYALIVMKNKNQVRPAVQTALAIISKIRMIDTMVEILKDFELQISVGIHSGTVFFGSVLQADKFYNYAVGQLVEDLHEIVQYASGNDILVSSEVGQNIAGNFALSALSKKTKVKNNDLNIFVLSQQKDPRESSGKGQLKKQTSECGIPKMLEETLQDYTNR